MISTLFVVGALVTSVLVVVNLLTNLWARKHYLVISLWATAVMLAIAWLAGLSWASLGLSLHGAALRSGLIWSAALVGIVVVGYLVAAALPWTRLTDDEDYGPTPPPPATPPKSDPVAEAARVKQMLQDARTADMGVGRVLYHSMLRIPIGTALMEEVAFRGVLLAAFTGTWGVIWGVAASSVLFGIWHVLPALEFHEASATTDRLGNGWRGKLTTVAGQVAGTGVAGVGFCLVRIWSHSLLPSIALHASLNALGFAASWAFSRRLREL